MTQIIETFFYEHGSELLFFEYDPRNWFFTMTLRIAPFFHITLKTVLKMTQRNKNFFFLNMTQRIERFLKIWLKELNAFLENMLLKT